MPAGRNGQVANGYMDMDTTRMMNNPGPPAYKLDREDTLAPHWWDVREWSKKVITFVVLGVAIIIAIIVAVVVVVEKKNKYPNYSQLSYSLVGNCMYSLWKTTSCAKVPC